MHMRFEFERGFGLVISLASHSNVYRLRSAEHMRDRRIVSRQWSVGVSMCLEEGGRGGDDRECGC